MNSTPPHLPVELQHLVISHLENTTDIARCALVNKTWYLVAVSHLWRGHFTTKTWQQPLPGRFYWLRNLLQLSESPDRFRFYSALTKFLHLSHRWTRNKVGVQADDHSNWAQLWDAELWRDCHPKAIDASILPDKHLETPNDYPFLKPSVKALKVGYISVLRDCSASNEFPASFWPLLGERCPELAYLSLSMPHIPYGMGYPKPSLRKTKLFALANALKALKVLVLKVRSIREYNSNTDATQLRTFESRTLLAILRNPDLLYLNVSMDVDRFPVQNQTLRKEFLCCSLRVLRLKLHKVEGIRSLLSRLTQLETLCVGIASSGSHSSDSTEINLITELIEPLYNIPKLTHLNLSNRNGISDANKGNRLAPGDCLLSLAERCPGLRSVETDLRDGFSSSLPEMVFPELAAALPLLQKLSLGPMCEPTLDALVSVSRTCPNLRILCISGPNYVDLPVLWDYMHDYSEVFKSLEGYYAKKFGWQDKEVNPRKDGFEEATNIANKLVTRSKTSMPKLLEVDYLHYGLHVRKGWTSITRLFVDAIRCANGDGRQVAPNLYHEAYRKGTVRDPHLQYEHDIEEKMLNEILEET